MDRPSSVGSAHLPNCWRSVSGQPGAKVEDLSDTDVKHAFVLVEHSGKGYTWAAQDTEEKNMWMQHTRSALVM